jgi:predicted AlkP superfamily pyrophosphatase or phosphodiesterase
MRKLFLALAASALAGTASSAQQQGAAPTPPTPRLIIAISVDQLSSDLLEDYHRQGQLTGGLGKLVREGTVFRNGYQAHAATETCPGHSTILTGMHPARNGVIANDWFDQRAARDKKEIYCAEDESLAAPAGTNYAVSPVHLKVPTLGDALKKLSPDSQNVAVAGKDRSAVMMSGHAADQRWYWSSDRFVTDLSGRQVPQVVAPVNAAVQASLAAGQPALAPPPFCAGRARTFQVGSKTVGNGAFARAAGDKEAFRASPNLDGATLALAAGLVQELRLGNDGAPDILSIGLAGTDVIGHRFGPGGQEMCLQLLALDRSLGDFFAQLDRWGVYYNVVLTADHGGLDIPERLRAKGVAQAQQLDPALSVEAIAADVGRQTGINGAVLHAEGSTGEHYIDRKLTAAQRARVLSAATAAYRAHPQVYAVYSRAEIMGAAIPSGDPAKWSVLERVRASFDPQRSGDFYVVAEPYVNLAGTGGSSVAGHGTPWDYDRRVPIIFWAPGLQPAQREEGISTTDIAPTLAGTIGIPFGAGLDGKCLSQVTWSRCGKP